MARGMLALATVGCFVLGGGMLVAFEATALRLTGAIVLLGYLACGVFLIADPAELSRPDEPEPDRMDRPGDG